LSIKVPLSLMKKYDCARLGIEREGVEHSTVALVLSDIFWLFFMWQGLPIGLGPSVSHLSTNEWLGAEPFCLAHKLCVYF
jgi:hypothetical protein